MAKRRRTKTKRTRIANSRKMARSRTKKLRKKNKRGGARYTGIDRARDPGVAKRLREAAQVDKQEADETAAAESLAEETYQKFRDKGDKYKQDEEAAYLKALRLIKISDPDYSPRQPKVQTQLQAGKASRPRSVNVSPLSTFNRYDREQDLCEIQTEKDPCDEQYGCYWNEAEAKCLPSSGSMETGEPTKGEPSSKQYFTDEEKKILEQKILENEKLQLLNKLLLASFGFDENGTNRIPILVLTDATELSKLVDKSEAEKLIQRIDDKASDMETMMKNGKKYVFPNTGGLSGPAGIIKRKMDTLKITLKRVVTDGIITDKETDDEEDGF